MKKIVVSVLLTLTIIFGLLAFAAVPAGATTSVIIVVKKKKL